MPMSPKRRQLSKRLPASTFAGQTRRGKKSAKRREKSVAKNTTGHSSHQYPVLKFLLIFGFLLAVFYVFIAFSRSYNKRFIPSYHHLIAEVSGALLAVFGQDITVTDASISSPRFARSPRGTGTTPTSTPTMTWCASASRRPKQA